MATETRMKMHPGIAITFIEADLRMKEKAGQPQNIVETDGVSIPYKEAYTYLRELRRKGYTFVPGCDNIRPDGHCAGHPVKED